MVTGNMSTGTADHLLAGTGRRCINPPDGIAHASWGAQVHEQAEGIDMDLWVTVLAVSNGNLPALVIDLDIQILTNEVADRLCGTVAEKTGVPVERIRASATHTHSGPTPYKSWITKGFEKVGPWFEEVYHLAGEAALDALAALTPVVVRGGRGECLININRRALGPTGKVILGKNRQGFSDHEVLVIKLDALQGSTVATLVNYACHATIMGPMNRLITPDYPGVVRRIVEGEVGGRCLFLQGAAGDQGPVQGFESDVSLYRKLGAVLGHEAAKVARSLDVIPAGEELREVLESGGSLGYYDDEFPRLSGLPVVVEHTEIPVPLRTDIPSVESARELVASAHAALQSARERNDDGEIREAIVKSRRADLKLRLAEDFQGRSDVGVRSQFICFGDVALVSFNIEPFAAIGAQIKARSPFPFTMVSGYSNGRMAYMPTAEEWHRGGHEVVNSPFGEHAGNELAESAVARLQEIRSRVDKPVEG